MISPVEIAKRKWTRVSHRIHTLPVVILMPHSRCNCRCVMCDIWRANAAGQSLPRESLEAHIETFRKLNVQWVVLSGGEALMHKDLWSLCELIKTLGAKITVLSTGLLLKRNAEQVVRWADEVTVSLDGSPEIHDSIRRVPRAYERLAEGVRAVKALKPDFPITARCVIQQQNFRDLPNIIDTARETGLDRISFLSVDVSSEAFNRPEPWSDERIADVALSPNEVAEFEQIVEDTIVSHAADFASGFVAENPDKLRRLPRYFAALNGAGEFPETFCNAPWTSTVIETDGNVRPCFFHPVMGNVNDTPLEDILNSEQAIAFRRGLDVKTNPICRKCVCTFSLGARTPIGTDLVAP
ncbi:MAG TPA: radical SAM protein [Thermomicrobiales bacterium]|nr:radical SAM protein [Thermomicrobiales bacterium]